MGTCCQKSITKKDLTVGHVRSAKKKDLTSNKEAEEVSFVDIIHKDGNTSKYIHNAQPPPTVSGSEVISISAETIDQKKTSLQIAASEKITALKQKICESLSLSEILLIFDGKVLDQNELIGSTIPQGSCVDVIAL